MILIVTCQSIGVFVIGLSQISFFFSLCILNITRVDFVAAGGISVSQTHLLAIFFFSVDNRKYIPESCCKDPSNSVKKNKCVGRTNRKIAPVRGPPVQYKQRNDQMFTQVRTEK